MASSDMLTGMLVGAIIAAALVSVFVIVPMGDDEKPPISVTNGHADPNALGEYTQLTCEEQIVKTSAECELLLTMSMGDQSRRMSLVEIFEMAEPGVVRLNVDRGELTNVGDGGVGSGFVYDKRGHIITNAHVITEAREITVTFLDGSSYIAQTVGIDPFTDIAVLLVDVDPALLKPLKFGDSSGLKVGQPAVAIGNPFGLSGSMTSGIISQIGRLLPSNTGYSIPDVIQTDAAINPGNSGGPLLNMRGEVIGINNAIQSTTGEFAGIGFAIPSQTVIKVAPTLISDGKYSHPWIGVSGKDLNLKLANVMDIDTSIGFLVISVIDGSPADVAGILGSDVEMMIDGELELVGGDVIVGVDDQDIRKIDDILLHLQRTKSVGDVLQLEIIRDGMHMNVDLVLAERPD